jgi:hypothetical protein
MAEVIDDTETFTIALTPPHVPDLMPGQTCVGPDLHQLISGGLIGDLIEANSPKCPSAPPEDKGIFGDLDTKWIIIAIVGIIILGLLS